MIVSELFISIITLKQVINFYLSLCYENATDILNNNQSVPFREFWD